MRKMLLAGLAALLMLLVLPGAVSAALVDTVTVSGTISISMDVSASPETIEFSTMVNGTMESSTTTVTVTTTSANWNVKASDELATTKGFMYKTGPVKLTAPLYLSKDTGATVRSLRADWTGFMSGTTAGTTPQVTTIQQVIYPTDSSGSYTITITFTGTAS